MTDNPDVKKKLLKQIDNMRDVLAEHGIRGHVSDIGVLMAEFTVQTTKPLDRLVMSLYRRDGVERVLIQKSRAGRGVQFIQICFTESF